MSRISAITLVCLCITVFVVCLLDVADAQMFGMGPFYGNDLGYSGSGGNYGSSNGIASTWLLCSSVNCGRG
uniref:Uncharacterized protein n=1 Tax=Ditylenchus dipsaci TaxID=166011 RepID=A0A915EDE1_9BILA